MVRGGIFGRERSAYVKWRSLVSPSLTVVSGFDAAMVTDGRTRVHTTCKVVQRCAIALLTHKRLSQQSFELIIFREGR